MGLMSGKNVAIFGIANKRSIAWGIAQALHREGARLALNFQNERMEEPVRKLAAELPGDTFLAPCDVTVPGDVQRLLDTTLASFGRVDAWVNNAGADILTGPAGSWSEETKWDRVMAVDLKGTWLCSRCQIA